MNYTPLVSIIIPVYNVSPFIEECLNSVIGQTYTHLEVIIIDDCSTDDSLQKVQRIVNNYGGDISFSILSHNHNSGLSAARNTGLNAASGEYISFLDSDDYLFPTLYETLVRAIIDEDDNVAIVGCHSISNNTVDNNSNASIKRIPSEDFAEEFLSAKTSCVVWAKIFKRVLFESIKFREGRNGEDFLFAYDLYPLIERMHYETVILPDQLYYYRIREDSITSSINRPFFETKTNNYREILTGLRNKKHACVGAVEKRFVCHLYYCIVSFAAEKNTKEYYRYCLKLWGVSTRSAKRELPAKSDFKPFLMMKYLPFGYYLFIQIRNKNVK